MKQENGFSLVETMIAMVLISLLMLAIPSLPGIARFTQEFSASSAVAENIAENTLEIYRNIPFNNITDSHHTPLNPASFTINTYGTDRTYTPNVTVTGYKLGSPGSFTDDVNLYTGGYINTPVYFENGTAFNESDIKIVTVTLTYQVQGRTTQVIRRGIYRPD